MSKRSSATRIKRQSVANRTVHWLVAAATFALFFSGFGQMPMYDRYGLSALPGMSWAGDYHINLTLHYVAGAILVFAVVMHIALSVMTRAYAILPRRGDLKESVEIIAAMLGRGDAPASHKYLAEQRLAYAFIGSNLLVLVVTGLLKVAKNLPGVSFDPLTLFVNTALHNGSAMLLMVGVVGHFAAFIFKENRVLLPAVFDGTVDAEYARQRHSLWYAEVAEKTAQTRGDEAA